MYFSYTVLTLPACAKRPQMRSGGSVTQLIIYCVCLKNKVRTRDNSFLGLLPLRTITPKGQLPSWVVPLPLSNTTSIHTCSPQHHLVSELGTD